MRSHDVGALHTELAVAFATREYPGGDAIAHKLDGKFAEARE